MITVARPKMENKEIQTDIDYQASKSTSFIQEKGESQSDANQEV